MFSKLIFNNIRYRGHLFCITPAMTNGDEGFFALRDFRLLEVDTTTQRTKKQFGHGEVIGSTYNYARECVLVFDAFASNEIDRFRLVKKINNLFYPSDTWSKLEFSGPDGSEWRFEAKTIERPSYSDYDNDRWITVTVKLISRNNSNIYGTEKNVIYTTNHPFGIIMSTDMPFTYGIGGVIIDYHGSPSPVHIDVIATQNNATPYGYLIIKNTMLHEQDSLITLSLLEFNKGDIIRIDSTNQQVYRQKDGTEARTNITANTTPHSTYPALISGKNNVGIYNGVEDVMMNIHISYYEVRS